MRDYETELQTLVKKALATMKQFYGTEEDEFGTTLFVSHHLEHVEPSYWVKHINTDSPSEQQIIDLLILKPPLNAEEDFGTLDFTLPDGITDYMICVFFDEVGDVEDITMES